MESDDDRFPVVGKFAYDPDSVDCASLAISKAEKRIDDLNAGRLDPRKCAKEIQSVK